MRCPMGPYLNPPYSSRGSFACARDAAPKIAAAARAIVVLVNIMLPPSCCSNIVAPIPVRLPSSDPRVTTPCQGNKGGPAIVPNLADFSENTPLARPGFSLVNNAVHGTVKCRIRALGAAPASCGANSIKRTGTCRQKRKSKCRNKNDARDKPAHHSIDECDPDYSAP